MLLSVGLKRLYPEYEFQIVPVVIGATGYVPNTLHNNLIGFKGDTIDMEDDAKESAYGINESREKCDEDEEVTLN